MNIKKKSLLLIVSILLVVYNVLSPQVMASELKFNNEGDRVINVSITLSPGFFEIDENGNYSGYTYEYLMKIAQRTGWRYEFNLFESSNDSIQESLDKVQSGELDLLGAMVYSDTLAAKYDYTSVPYGETNFVLMAADDNEEINVRTLFDLPELRVALIETAKIQNGEFEKYAKTKGLVYQPIYAQDGNECRDLVKSGKADVLISKDVIKNDGLKTVVKFASQPFYFATTKGNTQLVIDLSRVIAEINSVNPYYQLTLYDKYFTNDSITQLDLTTDEIDYLKNVSPLRALVLKYHAPVEDYDPKTNLFSGIIVDILREISDISNLSIEFIPIEDVEQAQELLDSGQADLFVGFPYDYATAEKRHLLMTSPIFSMPVMRISNIKGEARHDKILVSSSIKMFNGEDNIIYVENIKDIFDLVNRGEYESAYVNGYMAQRYIEQNNLPNITIMQTPYTNYELCIGVRRDIDLRLMSILEQAIVSIKTSDIEDIVYKNTVYVHSMSFIDMIKRNPTEFLIPTLAVLILIIVLLLLLFYKSRLMNKYISEEKNRYKTISAMDRLAQTYNNETFKQLVKEYLAITDPVPCGSLLICDIDGFKDVNDTYGHLVGDEIIHSMGKLLGTIFRDYDLVGRLGGDEFVMLMKNITDKETIERRCEELQAKCRNISDQCEITLSIGGSIFNGNVYFDDLFKKADDALYEVKKNGKNGFMIR